MSDNQATGNANMPSEEKVREYEETILNSLSDAENGDEAQRRVLLEFTDEQLAAICVCCRPAVLCRLTEFYCLSFKTARQAFLIADFMAKTEKIKQLMADLSVKNVGAFIKFVPAFIYLAQKFDHYDWSERDMNDMKWIEATATIQGVARTGYPLAQYWTGFLAEHDHDVPDDENDYHMDRAIQWYRKAADQGFVPAQKHLPIVTEQRYGLRWRCRGKCQHCGGSFKGIFKKVCSSCGKPKDY